MGFLHRNGFPLAALAVLVGVIMLSRGGGSALVGLAKIVLPLVLAVVIFRALKSKVLAKMPSMQDLMAAAEKQREAQMARSGRGSASSAGGPTIDICPKCGNVARSGHRCP